MTDEQAELLGHCLDLLRPVILEGGKHGGTWKTTDKSEHIGAMERHLMHWRYRSGGEETGAEHLARVAVRALMIAWKETHHA